MINSIILSSGLFLILGLLVLFTIRLVKDWKKSEKAFEEEKREREAYIRKIERLERMRLEIEEKGLQEYTNTKIKIDEKLRKNFPLN